MGQMHFNSTAFLFLFGYYLLINLILYCTMVFDKKAAINNKRRVPEKNLYLMSVLGGALGGLLALVFKRHKSRHIDFIIVFSITLLLHLLVIFWIMSHFILTFT